MNLKESEKKDKYLDLARELKKKPMEHESNDVCPIVIGPLGTMTKGLLKGLEDYRDYPNNSSAKNGQNTETSPGDLSRLAVTQTPV